MFIKRILRKSSDPSSVFLVVYTLFIFIDRFVPNKQVPSRFLRLLDFACELMSIRGRYVKLIVLGVPS